ncbi:MAG: SDR family oxidoreductase [Bacteroidetes bacterium]|nr:SDR family oxidoreductase [Bacteroidota bacterium]
MSYALITGASKGIGKAIAEELASRGYDILLVARSQELLAQTASAISTKHQVKTDFLATDLSAENAALQVFNWCTERKYSITVLVNNAGYGLSGPMEKYSVEENRNMMQLNMIVPTMLCQLFLPMLKLQTKAYIMNIASSAAYQAVPYLSIYSASKSFVLNFSRGLHQELKNTNISVTCISPGATDTDFVVRAQIGEKGLKTASNVNMSPSEVAKIAVNGMLAGKTEVITGLVNKLGAFAAWLLPKGMVESSVMKIYK